MWNVRLVLLLAYNVLRVIAWPLRWLLFRLRRGRARWVQLSLRGTLEELGRPRPNLLRRLVPTLRPERRTVAEVRALCDRVLGDARVEGVLVQLEHVAGGYPTLASLRAELSRLHKAGKRVVCYLPLGADQRTLYAATAAERLLVMPEASFSTLGPAASRTYVRPLLERIGVEAEVLAEGRFKSAAEPLVRDSMSDPERTQLEAIVEALHADWVEQVGARAALGPQGAAGLFSVGLFGGKRAKELGVVDACIYEDQLPGELGLGVGERPVASSRYRGDAPPRMLVPLRPRKRVALVRLSGAIGERAMQGGIGLYATTALLRRVARDRRIAGVLLHIDSPGGSALVSELLHREVVQLAQKKPVVAWLGNVAASGGYYLACAAPVIVAHPATLTGSIGVISLRPVLARLLTELGVRREVVGSTPFADLHTITRRSTAAEEALLRAESRRVYTRFIEVVADGRQRDAAQIEALAEGRVWSGRDAAAVGLVDQLGGYYEARAQLARLLGATAVEQEPWLVAPPRVAATAPFPAAEDPRRGALSELGFLADLAELARGGDRVLTYAVGLPRLR